MPAEDHELQTTSYSLAPWAWGSSGSGPGSGSGFSGYRPLLDEYHRRQHTALEEVQHLAPTQLTEQIGKRPSAPALQGAWDKAAGSYLAAASEHGTDIPMKQWPATSTTKQMTADIAAYREVAELSPPEIVFGRRIS